jgi:23S rRNA pseudouridine2605 synthase
MRLNKFIALGTGISRRAADTAIANGLVSINETSVTAGQQVDTGDIVTFRGKVIRLPDTQTILLHKPVGYVVSREGQGSSTIYDLLPKELHSLKPVGRLDKDSSGLLLLTNDGDLANRLTHPSYQKDKTYRVELDKPLGIHHQQEIQNGVELSDGLSRLQLRGADKKWVVTMSEGRNRQIRRTFSAIGYTVTKLHRTHFGEYQLQNIGTGQYTLL